MAVSTIERIYIGIRETIGLGRADRSVCNPGVDVFLFDVWEV